MRVYLAGEQFSGVEDKVKRRLFSYWYNKSKSKDYLAAHELGVDCFLDSGAYTAFTQKVDISLDDFASFIHRTKHIWTCVSNLDDTSKNEKKSYDNQKALESLGCKIQPVFHTREDPRWLVKYLDEGYDYIFIGGMVAHTTGWLRSWLDEIWANYLTNPDGTARVKVHGFGLTDQQLMFRYPWHSVDSTSWLFTGAMGSCMFWVDGKARKVTFSLDSPSSKNADAPHYSRLPAIARDVVDVWLADAGVTAEQCASHYSYRNIVNAASFQKMEDYAALTFKRTQKGLFDD